MFGSFRVDGAKNQLYLDFGRVGGSPEDFFENILPTENLTRGKKSDTLYSNDKLPVNLYATGLVSGGHLNILKEFYNNQKGAPYADDILMHAMQAAVVNKKGFFMFDAIKGMHRDPDGIEDKFRDWMVEKNNQAALLNQFDKLRREFPQRVTNLTNEIDSHIKSIKKDGGYKLSESNTEQWDDDTSRYPQKLNVLIGVQKYLKGESGIDKLRQVIEENSKYDKTSFFAMKKSVDRSDTGVLVDQALQLMGDKLKPELSYDKFKEKLPTKVQNLKESIELYIENVKKAGGYKLLENNTEQWKDRTSRYFHKYNVLIAARKYLNGESDINALERAITDNPKYDKGDDSRVGHLVDKVRRVIIQLLPKEEDAPSRGPKF